jgi:cellulose synthase/poly-beta-1,6-N-acetylglucosamine synthase-like glycosyltransferase
VISIIIPTYNAVPYLAILLEALEQQILTDAEVVVIDSSSLDNTVEIARSHGVRTLSIPKHEFDHGLTRTMGAQQAQGEILVYLTQDALPIGRNALVKLIEPFGDDRQVGVTFGRQLSRADATPFGQHLRLFNYPAISYRRSLSDCAGHGIRAAFCSNSFAAYRKSALEEVGWFKGGLLMGEDMHACATMLLKGYKVAYAADATVLHSHNYAIAQEFKRYFDMGVFLQKERWILDTFGKAEGEGLRFVRSELAYLWDQGLYHLIPASIARAGAKWLGYRLGHMYTSLPRSLMKRLSMHST